MTDHLVETDSAKMDSSGGSHSTATFQEAMEYDVKFFNEEAEGSGQEDREEDRDGMIIMTAEDMNNEHCIWICRIIARKWSIQKEKNDDRKEHPRKYETKSCFISTMTMQTHEML